MIVFILLVIISVAWGEELYNRVYVLAEILGG